MLDPFGHHKHIPFKEFNILGSKLDRKVSFVEDKKRILIIMRMPLNLANALGYLE